MTEDDPLITATDVVRVFCAPGMRKWARRNNVDLRHFVRNGMPASQLLGRGDDALIERIIAAKAEVENGRGR